MSYKIKYKQFTLNPLKQPQYTFDNEHVILNLNACFPKLDNFVKFMNCLQECKEESTKLNLCNLASLCYKVGVDYASQETLDFVKTLINRIKEETDFTITQDNIENCGEIDMQPITYLIKYDNNLSVLYVNNVLVDCLKVMGYVESQVYNVVDFSRNLKNVIPEDLQETLPVINKRNNGCYNMIKELLV